MPLKSKFLSVKAIPYQKPDGTSTTVYADLYKRSCFILETKQGAHAKKDNPDQLPLLVGIIQVFCFHSIKFYRMALDNL